jgi:hypothetical protein
MLKRMVWVLSLLLLTACTVRMKVSRKVEVPGAQSHEQKLLRAEQVGRALYEEALRDSPRLFGVSEEDLREGLSIQWLTTKTDTWSTGGNRSNVTTAVHITLRHNGDNAVAHKIVDHLAARTEAEFKKGVGRT